MTTIAQVCTDWGIDKEIAKEYEQRYSISLMYDWQANCIYKTNVMNGENLIYCAPTGGGKTLISELAIIKTCTLKKKLALYVLPYVSLVLEKESYFKGLFFAYNKLRPAHARIKVKSLQGSNAIHQIRSLMKKNIIICTYEKATYMVNMMILAGMKSDVIGCCVVDEFHHVGSTFNGPTLEGLLCKLQYFTRGADQGVSNKDSSPYSRGLSQISKDSSLQIIGLSATIGNAQVLANWLHAQLFITHSRPISLSQFLVVRGVPFNIANPGIGLESLAPLGAISNNPSKGMTESRWEEDALLALCVKALNAGTQMLIFCPTKAKCSQTCIFLAERLASSHQQTNIQIDRSRQEWIARLRTLDAGSFNLLSPYKNALQRGAAFHHAGLSEPERGSVEAAFKSGVLRILACTTTLAAGVNLPANIVVIRGLRVGKEIVSAGQYRQMCGRAGRPGFGGGHAEAYLLIKQSEWQDALNMATQPLPDVLSVLDPNRKGTGTATTMTHLIMEVFSLGLVRNITDALDFIQFSLLHFQATVSKKRDIQLGTVTCIKYLVEIGALISSENNEKRIFQHESRHHLEILPFHKVEPTRFGRAIVQGGFSIEDAVLIYNELVRAEDCLHLSSKLHCLYLIAPLASSSAIQVDWGFLFDACAQHSTSASTKAEKVIDPGLESLVSILKLHNVEEAVLLNWHKFNAPSKFVQECFQPKQLLGTTHSCNQSVNDAQKPQTSMDPQKLRQLGTCVRVWAAWILLQLVNGTSEEQVCLKYDTDNSYISDLVKHANIMSRKMQRFSKEMGWKSLEALFVEIKSIIAEMEGKPEELVPLLACSCREMTPQVARCLWNNNIRDPLKLAETPLREIAYKLHLTLGFVSNTFAIEAHPHNLCSRQQSEEEEAYEDLVTSTEFAINKCRETLDEYQHTILLAYVLRLQTAAKKVLTNKDSNAVTSLIDISPFLSQNQLCEVGKDLTENELNCDSESDDESIDSLLTNDTFLSDKTSNNIEFFSPLPFIEMPPHIKRRGTLKSGFVMRHLRSQQHWHTFLDHIPSVKCASLQVMFRRIPNCISLAAVSTRPSHSWVEFTSGKCMFSDTEYGLDEGEGSLKHDVDCHLAEVPQAKDSHVLTGVGICFGGDESFFMPLPIPLPLTSFKHVVDSAHTAGIVFLPPNCRELICCFVGGFDCYLGAPPFFKNASNACLVLNRQWAGSARNALRKQWQTHGSLPWECLRHLLESPDVTIIGSHLHSQLEALYLRGLKCVRGHQIDPHILFRTHSVEEEARLLLPSRITDVLQTDSDHTVSRHIRSARRACFSAVAVLRVVTAYLQPKHQSSNLPS